MSLRRISDWRCKRRAILRVQNGGKHDICVHETRVCGIPFDQSIKQGGKERPCLFNMMRSVNKPIQEKWNEMMMGVRMKNNEGQQEECRFSHMIFTDNCYLFAALKENQEDDRGHHGGIEKREVWTEKRIRWNYLLGVLKGSLVISMSKLERKKYTIKAVEALQAMET